jgi:hypothetical protein
VVIADRETLPDAALVLAAQTVAIGVQAVHIGARDRDRSGDVFRPIPWPAGTSTSEAMGTNPE